jgi:hypothetical protein
MIKRGQIWKHKTKFDLYIIIFGVSNDSAIVENNQDEVQYRHKYIWWSSQIIGNYELVADEEELLFVKLTYFS